MKNSFFYQNVHFHCGQFCRTEQLVGKWVFCLILCGKLLPLVFRTTLWPDGSDATYFTPGSALTAANRNITFCLSNHALHLQKLLTVWVLPRLASSFPAPSSSLMWSLHGLSFAGLFFLSFYKYFWISFQR